MEEEDSWQEDQSMPDEEDHDQWSDEYSNTDFEENPYEEDPEPEPPDPYQDDNIPTDWSRHQAEPREGYESDSWQEETEAKSSLDSSEDWEHEPDEEAQLQLGAKEDPWEYQVHPDTGQENKLWCEDTNSYISLGETDEDEEEALDQEADPEDASGDSSGREDLNLSHDSDQDIEERSWCGEPFSGHEEKQTLSMKPYQDYGSWYEETDSQISNDGTRQISNDTKIQEGDLGVPEKEEALSEAGRNVDQPGYIHFAGHHQGPEAYFCWEKDMEHWFDSNQVPEEEKTAIAEDTLTEDAFRQWEREYVTGAGDELWSQIRVHTNPDPRRLILATRPNRKIQLKKSHDPKTGQESTLIIKGKTELTSPERVNGVQVVPTPKAKAQELSTKQLPKSNEEGKPIKSSKPLKPVEPICYRCHEKGHFAITCPTRLVVNSHSREVNSDSTSEVISQLVCKFPTSGIMHMSCPKDDYAGGQENEATKITQEETIKEPEPQAEHKPATNVPNVQLEQEAVVI
ncbi:hypothetical protein N665_2134s0004 [Sinapis alba]|nr:hypothetical protein N665_2134s0004 [Sinapis alba]